MSSYQRLTSLIDEFHQDMYDEHFQNCILTDDAYQSHIVNYYKQFIIFVIWMNIKKIHFQYK